MASQPFLKSKWATWLLIAVLAGVSLIAIRILIQKHSVDSEIAKLQAEADSIRKDNLQLSSVIKYLNTPEYEQKAAREKLNLKKDGEQVVVLPADQQISGASTATAAPESNPKKWFDYFFH